MIHLESQYRLVEQEPDSDVTQWSDIRRQPEDAQLVQFPSLEPGERYDLRVRFYDDDEDDFSAWRTLTGVLADVPRLNPPPAVVELRQTSGGCLSWRLPVDAPSVAGYQVRHALGLFDDDSAMEPAHQGLASGSPWPLCEVPGGVRTVSVRSVNHDGVVSEPSFVVIEVRPLDDAALFTADEQAGIGQPGQVTQGDLQGNPVTGEPEVVGTPYLSGDVSPYWPSDAEPFWSPDESLAWWSQDDAAPYWDRLIGDGLPFWSQDDGVAWWGPWFESAILIWPVLVDESRSGPGWRLSTSFDIQDAPANAPVLVKYRVPCGGLGAYEPALFWGPNPFDAFWTDDAAAYWSASGTEPFRPWPGRIEGLRSARYDLQYVAVGGREQGVISNARHRVSAGVREEVIASASIPQNGIRVPPSEPFTKIEEVSIEYLAGTPDGVTVHVEDLNNLNGPALVAKDAAGDPATAIISITLRGN